MDLAAAVRTPGFLKLLVLSGLLGIPISLLAFGFLVLIHALEDLVWVHLPETLGLTGNPSWLVVAIPAVAGLFVAAARLLPGDGGHRPLAEFGHGGPTVPKHLPSILLAALFTLVGGLVLGPEAPLIALGTGIAALVAARVAKGNATAAQLLVAAGAFAAVSAIFGNPLAAAILLIEALGIAGPMLSIVLLPGLLSAGVGYLVFTGIGDWTGLTAPTLGLPTLPPGGAITWSDIAWAILVGAVCAILMIALRRAALRFEEVAQKLNMFLILPIVGIVVGALALLFNVLTGESVQNILFSGETGVATIASTGTSMTLIALLLIVLLKSVAYTASLGSGFRGGAIFPSMFIGATLGLLAGQVLPGLSPLAGFAAGMAAGTAAMLRLPLAALLLVTLLTGSGGLQVLPIVIISVVVAVVIRALTDEPPTTSGAPSDSTLAPAANG